MSRTAGTIEDPNIQGHDLSMSTPAAYLTRVGRVHFDKLPASFFRFARELSKECRPRGICNAFRKTMIVGHTVDMQVFDTDDPEPINDLTAFLVSEVVTAPSNTFMDSGHNLAMFAPLRSAFLKFGMLALHFCQGLLFFAEEAWVGDFFTCGKRRKGFEPDIDPDLGSKLRQAFWFHFTGETGIPLAGQGAAYREGFDFPLERTMIHHLDMPNARGIQLLLHINAKTGLRIGDAIITTLAFEARVARIVAFAASAEKSFECQIDAHSNILQDLRMDRFQRRAGDLQLRERCLLSIQAEAFPLLLIR